MCVYVCVCSTNCVGTEEMSNFAAGLQEETFEAQWSGTKKPSKPGVPHHGYFSVLPAGKCGFEKKKSRKALTQGP